VKVEAPLRPCSNPTHVGVRKRATEIPAITRIVATATTIDRKASRIGDGFIGPS